MTKIQNFLQGSYRGRVRLLIEEKTNGFRATLAEVDGDIHEAVPLSPEQVAALSALFPEPKQGKRVRVPGLNLAVEVRGDSNSAEGTVVYCLASRWISLGSPRKLSSVTLLSKAREAIAFHPEIDHVVAREADFETEEGWAKVQEAREKLNAPEPEADPDDWSFSQGGPIQEEPTEQPPRPAPTMMGCGHTAQAIDQLGSPVCVICFGVNPGATVVAPTPDLSGRTAQCGYGNHKPVPSDVSLPFFAHKPGAKFDEYYCGCFGWD